MFETPTHPTGIVVFRKIFSAGETEEMPTIGEYWAEKKLEADWTLEGFLLKQFFDSMPSEGPRMDFSAFPRQTGFKKPRQLLP
jgi:hypothetical protein